MRTGWIFFAILVVLNVILAFGYYHKRSHTRTTVTTLLDEPPLTRYETISAETPYRVREFFNEDPQLARTWIDASDKLHRSIDRLSAGPLNEISKDFFYNGHPLPSELADSIWLGWTSYRDASRRIIEKNLAHHQHWQKIQERVIQTRARLLAGHQDAQTKKSWDSLTSIFFWSYNTKPDDATRFNQLLTVLNRQASMAAAKNVNQLLTSGDAILVGKGKIGQHNQMKSLYSLPVPEIRSLHRQLTILKGRVDQQLSMDLNVIVQ